MDERIARAVQAAFGDQGACEPAANHSRHTSITINGDITIQIAIEKNCV
nr:hypothetical protein [Marinobacterium profundum]